MIGFLQWLFSLQAAYFWFAGGVVFLLWYVFRNEMSRVEAAPEPEKGSVIPTVSTYLEEPEQVVPMVEPIEDERAREEAWGKVTVGPPNAPQSIVPRADIDLESLLAEKLASANWQVKPGSSVAMVRDPETKKLKLEVVKLDFELPPVEAQDVSADRKEELPEPPVEEQ